LAIGVYALGIRWLGLPLVPWALIDGGPERYDVSFFHHCGPPACLNVAWVLIFFFRPNQRRSSPFAILSSLAILVLVALDLPLWRSQSAGAIAGGIFIIGATWTILQRRGFVTPARIRTALALAFAALLTWQALWAWRSLHNFPDHWVSAQQTIHIAPVRDARIRAHAMQRGDRLAFSTAPARPIAWIAAARMAMDYPFLGWGPGSWVRIIPLYSNEPLIQTFFQHRQFAHHDLLQTAAEWGILPALLFLSLWIGALLRATANTDPKTAEGMNLTLAVVVLALHSTLHFPLQIPALQIWAALLLAAAWSTPKKPTPILSTETRAR
jgi:O-antigen ligase